MADPEAEPPAPSGNGRLQAGNVLAKFAWGLCSDPGPTREHNEDYADVHTSDAPDDTWERGPLFAVADGMGGHAAGEVASRIAVESLLAAWVSASQGPAQPALRSAARAANTAVVDAAFDPARRSMGTTLTAGVLSGNEFIVGHVGDSRAYLVRAGQCTQLTNDHSRVAEMVRMKMITAEQAATHPARSQLTRSLGGEPMVQVDLVRHDSRKDDVFVLCSDGLWDVISMAALAEEARLLVQGEVGTPLATAERLVQSAIDQDAADNVTAVVVHVTTDQPIPPANVRRSLFRRNRT